MTVAVHFDDDITLADLAAAMRTIGCQTHADGAGRLTVTRVGQHRSDGPALQLPDDLEIPAYLRPQAE